MKNNKSGRIFPLTAVLLPFLRYFSLTLVATIILSGCGSGGGGGGGGSSTTSGASVLSGTAAAGAPLANGTVTLKDSTGVTATKTADANGNYSFDVSTKQFPLMLEVQPNIPGAVPLFSAALTSGTANITPLTTLQVFAAAGNTDPSTIFNSGDFSKIGSATLDYGKTTVNSNLVSQLTSNGLATNLDPITTPMVANGAGQDAVMDHTSVAIIANNACLADSAGNPIPFADPNEMTLAVDGMSFVNFTAFFGLPIWSISIPFVGEIAGSNLSGNFGTNASAYVKSDLVKAGVAGIDQRRPWAPNNANPIILSNVSWSTDPNPDYTNIAVTQLKLQLKLAAQANIKAVENGGTPGPINIVAHSWGGIIAYIALTDLANSKDPTEKTIQVANLITMGTPIECLEAVSPAGDCPNYNLPIPLVAPLYLGTFGAKVSANVPSGYSGPIQKPSNVKAWTNYWGTDDVVSAKISPQPGVTNKYVDCEGNLYGDRSSDPTLYPCAFLLNDWTVAIGDTSLVSALPLLYQWGKNHFQYFYSPAGGISETLADIKQMVASSRADTSATQGTAPPTSGATTLPPTAFSVSAGNPFCDTTSAANPAVKLSWSAADGAVYYRVFRNGSIIGVNLNASQLSFADNLGLVAGQSYNYKVWAINSNGATWSNNVVQVTVPAAVCGTANPAPGSPGNTTTPLSFTTLTPASLSTSAASYQPTLTASGANFNNVTQIRFDWSGPTVGTKTWYKSDLNWNAKVVASSDGSSMTLAPVVTFAGDPPGLATWTVTLTDTTGTTATKTFTVNYTPPSTAPGHFSMSANANCNTTSPVGPAVALSWIASSGGVTYDVYRNGSLFQSGIAGTSFNDINVAAGQTYTYDVVANNPFGATQSNAVTATVPSTICSVSIPTTPTSLSPGSTTSPGPTLGSSTVTVSWNASSGAQLYIGGIHDIAANSDVVTINTSGTSTTATLSPGKQYRWYVEACNSSGCSSVSALYYFQTPGSTSTPPPPTATVSANPTTVPAGGQTTLTWSSTNATSCTASNGWSGSKATAGSQTVTVSSTAGTENFGLSCTNGSGMNIYTGVNVTVTAPVAAPPTISSVSPSSIPSDNNLHQLTISGSNFSTSGGSLLFTDPNGATYSSTAYPTRVVSVTASQWVYNINDASTPGTWHVQVINADAQSSNSASFTAAATTVMTAPTLTAPANYATGQSLTPTLQWSGGSATYWQVNVRNMSTGVMAHTSAALSPTQTSYAIPSGALQSGVQYRWDVAACPDTACLSGYVVSSDFYFTTAAATCTYPGAFSLSATPYWDTGSPHSVAASLSWTSSSNETSGYAIYRDGVNIGAVSGTTLLNNPPPPALLAGSSHSYYIMSSNTCGNTQSNTVSVTLTVKTTVSNTGGVGLNLRSAADYTSTKIANLPDGTIVTVYGGPTYAPVSSTSSGWWWQVSTPYGSGWVWGDYLY